MVTQVDAPGAAAIVAAVLLPPLAVYLVDGIGNRFWISVIVTILGWFPGVMFALWVVLGRRTV